MQETNAGGRRCRILAVEDDSGDLFLLERALREASLGSGVAVELVHCENGLEGLSSIALSDLTQRLPDIVIVDLNMPIMRGELFLRRVRVDLELPQLPAVVLTTSNARQDHAMARSVGANYVFSKPSQFIDLVGIANKIINVATGGEEIRVAASSARGAARRLARRRG